MTDSVKKLTLSDMFFEINKALCDTFHGLDPVKLLDYPAEDVFELINGLVAYNQRQGKAKAYSTTSSGVIRKPAGDNWF